MLREKIEEIKEELQNSVFSSSTVRIKKSRETIQEKQDE
jgi:hypothetical protein